MEALSRHGQLTHLVRRHRPTQTEQPQPHASNVQNPRRSLINHAQVMHLILARPKLLHHPHILNEPPDRKDRDGEGDGASEEEGELGEREVDGRVVEGVDECWAAGGGGNREEGLACGWREERGVLE